MTFTAIVTAHAESPHRILGNLMYQTRKPDEILCFVSDVPAAVLAELKEDFPSVLFYPSPNKNDWGHEKRSQGVAAAGSDYLGFFNHDDEYTLDYVERMMAEAEKGADAVYCGWSTYPRPAFQLGSSTSGNFIVRTELAQLVGYGSRAYEADGHFINAVANETDRIGFVPDVLYTHNAY